MTVRVFLVSSAESEAFEQERFDDGSSPLTGAGELRARAGAPELPGARGYSTAPSARCRRTAELLGVTAEEQPPLRDWDLGRWLGLRLDEVSAAEPEGVAGWLSDPAAAPHGGESLAQLCGRVGGWLDGRAPDGGRELAVVEPAVVRAALVHALGLPPQAFWRLDVPPLTVTELVGRAGRWNLRCGRPLTR
ncbi:histidine phosphatase family protein [Streptomyces sp. H39-S7]|uniref:histidine phosphatase family protein n=1 Tax=Streptomyces sp. H39-S7 TaxID=3004357 RepID=UPI0022B05FC3|nr:histidine phosphatase family protein [Streptomyces sp. H39-S7]MCZ4119438.1 histidine phosphatase family protein [Streptomyces sp. H39-S7]